MLNEADTITDEIEEHFPDLPETLYKRALVEAKTGAQKVQIVNVDIRNLENYDLSEVNGVGYDLFFYLAVDPDSVDEGVHHYLAPYLIKEAKDHFAPIQDLMTQIEQRDAEFHKKILAKEKTTSRALEALVRENKLTSRELGFVHFYQAWSLSKALNPFFELQKKADQLIDAENPGVSYEVILDELAELRLPFFVEEEVELAIGSLFTSTSADEYYIKIIFPAQFERITRKLLMLMLQDLKIAQQRRPCHSLLLAFSSYTCQRLGNFAKAISTNVPLMRPLIRESGFRMLAPDEKVLQEGEVIEASYDEEGHYRYTASDGTTLAEWLPEEPVENWRSDNRFGRPLEEVTTVCDFFSSVNLPVSEATQRQIDELFSPENLRWITLAQIYGGLLPYDEDRISSLRIND